MRTGLSNWSGLFLKFILACEVPNLNKHLMLCALEKSLFYSAPGQKSKLNSFVRANTCRNEAFETSPTLKLVFFNHIARKRLSGGWLALIWNASYESLTERRKFPETKLTKRLMTINLWRYSIGQNRLQKWGSLKYYMVSAVPRLIYVRIGKQFQFLRRCKLQALELL